jgi:hypothetical protein
MAVRATAPKGAEDKRVGKTRWDRTLAPSERSDFMELSTTLFDWSKNGLMAFYERTNTTLTRRQRCYIAARNCVERHMQASSMSRVDAYWPVFRAFMIRGAQHALMQWTNPAQLERGSDAKRTMRKRGDRDMFAVIETQARPTGEPDISEPPEMSDAERDLARANADKHLLPGSDSGDDTSNA